jgi:hypothetical protein
VDLCSVYRSVCFLLIGWFFCSLCSLSYAQSSTYQVLVYTPVSAAPVPGADNVSEDFFIGFWFSHFPSPDHRASVVLFFLLSF